MLKMLIGQQKIREGKAAPEEREDSKEIEEPGLKTAPAEMSDWRQSSKPNSRIGRGFYKCLKGLELQGRVERHQVDCMFCSRDF